MPKPSQPELDQALNTLVKTLQYYFDEEKAPEKAAVLYPAIFELGSLYQAGAMFEKKRFATSRTDLTPLNGK